MDVKTAAALIAKLKKRYRDYQSNITRGHYCVGGAFCRGTQPFLTRILHDYITGYTDELLSVFNFPLTDSLVPIFKRMNLSLDTTTARQYAKQVINYNRLGNFKAAWHEIEKALVWPHEPLQVG
jgi:hypothetical protein